MSMKYIEVYQKSSLHIILDRHLHAWINVSAACSDNRRNWSWSVLNVRPSFWRMCAKVLFFELICWGSSYVFAPHIVDIVVQFVETLIWFLVFILYSLLVGNVGLIYCFSRTVSIRVKSRCEASFDGLLVLSLAFTSIKYTFSSHISQLFFRSFSWMAQMVNSIQIPSQPQLQIIHSSIAGYFLISVSFEVIVERRYHLVWGTGHLFYLTWRELIYFDGFWWRWTNEFWRCICLDLNWLGGDGSWLLYIFCLDQFFVDSYCFTLTLFFILSNKWFLSDFFHVFF